MDDVYDSHDEAFAVDAVDHPGGFITGRASGADNPNAFGLVVCMPCMSGKSGVVGRSRAESLSPARTIRAGHGKSAGV